jgi:hypothetical protein
MAYLVADGFNVALVDLDPIVPQPRSPARVQAAQRDFGADGSVFEIGLFIRLQWTSLGNNPATYQTLLGQLGLDNALRNAITIYAPNFERVWTRYNGYAIRPQVANYTTFLQDVVIVVNRLAVSS